MTTRLRTALIGAGAFGANHAGKLAGLPRSDFQGIYDPHIERADALAARFASRALPDLDALFEAAEAVIIASPATTHERLVRQALEAGLHVLAEKPLALSGDEARALTALAASRGLRLQAGHQERFVMRALGLFSAPERPSRIEAVREGPPTGRGLDVSVTYDLMIHDLDLAAALLGADPLRIEARGSGAPFDAAEARLVFAHGEAVFTASRVAPARRRTMRVVYPSGEVALDFLARCMSNSTSFPLNADFAERLADPLGANVAAFLDAALGLPADPLLEEPGAAAAALAEAVERAALVY